MLQHTHMHLQGMRSLTIHASLTKFSCKPANHTYMHEQMHALHVFWCAPCLHVNLYCTCMPDEICLEFEQCLLCLQDTSVQMMHKTYSEL